MRNISKPILIAGGLVLVAIVSFLAFGVFAVQTLFIDEEVAEANPFDVNAQSSQIDASAAPGDSDSAADDASAEGEASASAETEDPPADAEPETPVITTITTGSFVDGDHPTSGTGLTITDGNQTFLRFEGFETDNGPDLNVYLRNSDDPDDYLDLGDLKGNIGDQNYELPAGIDLDRYDLVDIWCVRFGVSFGSAQLNA